MTDPSIHTIYTGRSTLTSGRHVTISTPHPDAAVQAIDTARRGIPRPNTDA